jgi:hypothetical protein
MESRLYLERETLVTNPLGLFSVKTNIFCFCLKKKYAVVLLPEQE